jgi:hypothetical protein
MPQGRIIADPLHSSPTPSPEPRPMNTTEFEAAAFRRLLQHLRERADVQNIDLMILAGFCRNCLSDWYREAAAATGTPLSKDEAREAIYGMPFAEWKARYQREATPEQLAAFEATQRHEG